MTRRVDPDRLRVAVSEIYRKLGVCDHKAALLADSLVMADLWGHSSHGVMRAAWYADRIASKVMDVDAEPAVTVDTGPLVGMDGHNGIGQHITSEAVEQVAARAGTYGIACVSIRRSGHFGAAMYFTKMLAERNMIGFLATNASPAMAPFGSREKLIGNNPQSCAAPTGLSAPFILDISHTEVARGKIYLAKERREAIPENWALDQSGAPTTDPAQAILGTLLPMGGHKGFGLSAMMDVLSGILSGSAFGTDINGPYVPDRPSGVGHFLYAIDIARLRELDDFMSDMQSMIATWKASQTKSGVCEIFYPGEKEHRHHLGCLSEGLKLHADIVSNLVSLAKTSGLPLSEEDLFSVS